MKLNKSGFNILVTNVGEKTKISNIYVSHIWIHDNIVKKNHSNKHLTVNSFITNSEIKKMIKNI
jgi:hypothetical protein